MRCSSAADIHSRFFFNILFVSLMKYVLMKKFKIIFKHLCRKHIYILNLRPFLFVILYFYSEYLYELCMLSSSKTKIILCNYCWKKVLLKMFCWKKVHIFNLKIIFWALKTTWHFLFLNYFSISYMYKCQTI